MAHNLISFIIFESYHCIILIVMFQIGKQVLGTMNVPMLGNNDILHAIT